MSQVAENSRHVGLSGPISPTPESTIVPLSALTPADWNPRAISKKAAAGLRASLKRWGLVQPIVVNRRSGRIVGGHQRVEALAALGAKDAEVKYVDLSDAEEKALNVSLNNPGIAGEFTKSIGALIGEIKLSLPSLDFDELRLDELADPPAIVEDEVPDPPKVAVTKPGDLWVLGRHRVLCGDGSIAASVARVTGNDPVVMVTDPPYCSGGSQEAQKKAGTWGDIAADNLSTRGYQSLLGSVLAARPLRAVYIFTDWRMWITLFDLVEAKGHAVRSMLVWAKEAPAMGGIWRTQHELILFASRENQAKREGEGSIGNVLRAARTGNVQHYTEKPVSLIADIIRNDGTASARKDSNVYDPFLGSGTTLIAAEQLDRVCYGLEIEPRYVDVIIERWSNLTGGKAVRASS